VRTPPRWTGLATLLCAALLCTVALPAQADDHSSSVSISKATYDDEEDRLNIEGTAGRRASVALAEAGSGIAIATVTADRDGKWKYEARHPNAIPCRVRATSNGRSAERDVNHSDDFAGGCGLGNPPTPEVCTDTVDNDGDGLIDCADPDCASATVCQAPPSQEICTDTVDNDGDGLIDCADPDCASATVCQAPPSQEICTDTVDNDGDGLIDCADPDCASATVCQAPPAQGVMKHDLVIPMNYELGMHCTGFDFSYCCVLPPYNSILAQVVKTEKSAPHVSGVGRPSMLGADPADHTVVLDPETGAKYRLLYWHEDQRSRAEAMANVAAADGSCPGCSPTTVNNDPNGHVLNTQSEGSKLLYWSAYYDVANGTSPADSTNPADVIASGDNFANQIFSHLYIYADAEGTIPGHTTADSQQLNFGIDIPIPVDAGPAGHPVSSKFNSNGSLATPAYLTYTGKTGTVVYTDSPVTPFDDFAGSRTDVVQIDNVPIVLTNPGIWEALGLPLTPFADGVNLTDPTFSESALRPYARMTAEVVDLNNNPVLDSTGNPQVSFGTAPIDIPNCERCHSNARANDRPDLGGAHAVNTAIGMQDIPTLVASEYDYWRNTMGLSDWYARIKASAISILGNHDYKHGTGFLNNYDPTSTVQTSYLSRLGRQAVICHNCHADNVIAVLESKKLHEINPADRGSRWTTLYGNVDDLNNPFANYLVPALTEAMHGQHLAHSPMTDGQGRSGACQGCHPAHRSDGSMANYPITTDGLNAFGPEGGNPTGDNRDAAGGCFVGRDVHSNSARYGEIPAGDIHLNAVGQWLQTNVANGAGSDKGIWCTNCHTQLQRDLYKADHLTSAINPAPATTVRDAASLTDLATQLNAAGIAPAAATGATTWTSTLIAEMLDPGSHRAHDFTTLPWLAGRTTGNIAAVSVSATLANPANPDIDGEYNVSIIGLDPNVVPATDLFGNPAPADTMLVPQDAATDGRDYWLSVGAPKCADCHTSPFVEGLGGVPTAYAVQLGLATAADEKETDTGAFPINQPAKYSNNRYTKGHQGITCQGCHESIHGLYPVTPPGYVAARAIDETSWEQAAMLNNDSTHGPVKCASCHETNTNGTVKGTDRIRYNGVSITANLPTAVAWAHTYTAGSSKLDSTCLRCHSDKRSEVDCAELSTHMSRGRIELRHAQAVDAELGLGCGF